jgi:PHP family Zn ribbon phosphoesterase
VNRYKADLHIHTVLSPCANIEMSPVNIVKRALMKGLNIIGITDHNSTLQCATVKELAAPHGIMVLCGAEVTSKEEIHCLAFFEDDESLAEFQKYLMLHQLKQPNTNNSFGYQVVVDKENNITAEIDNYLGMSMDVGYLQIQEMVHQLNGLFIPAHIDRIRFSLMSQLGFVPNDINADALEIFNRTSISRFMKENGYLTHYTFIRNSDAHNIDDIGQYYSWFIMNELSFSEIRMALRYKNGRLVTID